MREEVVDTMVALHIPHDAYAEAWDVDGLAEDVEAKLNLDPPIARLGRRGRHRRRGDSSERLLAAAERGLRRQGREEHAPS